MRRRAGGGRTAASLSGSGSGARAGAVAPWARRVAAGLLLALAWAAPLAGLILPASATAQTEPVVTISGPESVVYRSGNLDFTVTRTGATTDALNHPKAARARATPAVTRTVGMNNAQFES